MCRAVTNAIGLAPPKMPPLPAPPPPPPTPPAPPPVPTQADADPARDAARRQASMQRGRAATILTGAQGLTGSEPTARPTATKVLLGG